MYSAKIIQRTDAIRMDGSAALCLQVIIARKRKVFPLRVWVKPGEFDERRPAVALEKAGKEWRRLEENYNAILNTNLSRALNIIAEAQAQHRDLDIVAFTERFSNGKLDNCFLAFMEAAIEKEQGLLSTGTTEDNIKVLNRLRDFKQHLPFSAIHLQTLKDFQKHLQRKFAPTTIAATHKGFRKFIIQAQAIYPGLANPYKQFKVKWPDQERIFLEPAELMCFLEAYDEPGLLAGAMRRACRCFLFQCFTGLRVGDASSMTLTNVVGDYLVFVAEKTKKIKLQRKLRLNAIARRLISDAAREYGLKKQSDSLLNFYKDENVYNRALGNLAAFIGLEKKFPKGKKSHVGRHTFATNYLLAGGKVERLMRLMGHSKLETTMIYVHLVEDYLDQDMENYAAAFDLKNLG